MKLTVTNSPDAQLDEHIIDKTREHNADFTPSDYQPLSVYAQNDEGHLIGGLTAKVSWNYLDLEYLWVDEEFRGKGYASDIVARAENSARALGCKYVQVDTFEFQALTFYLKQGYEQFAELDGYAGQYKRYYLKKQL